ncbi:hypothetical protein K402DRAFT_398270 [Aulographum hederae CBS 113979]|uniref:Thymidylate kinase n=1 Tax=Aulographum hederae CBS 113979 TaxID=1176131 RepID=A0A6G1GLC8_9PEZI|nr:hypothetical protein K402DRAFT_398270 [Aulographum hederae CBS 113979]
MTTHVPARQPFAVLGESRLQQLTNIKNRQNAIQSTSLSSPAKSILSSPMKRRHTPDDDLFADDVDSENIDPSLFNSPSKRSKNVDGTPQKSKFVLTDSFNFNATPKSPLGSCFGSASSSLSPRPSSVKKSLSLSVPATTHNTPISSSRGSPKHNKRITLLKQRRSTSNATPIRRVDPPSFGKARVGAGLPFSIDAALSGTIAGYTPKEEAVPAPAPANPAADKDHMPKGWFFDIYEETPEEEAANLMEHSACCLDISSDDDAETKQNRLEQERGKENVPPPDWVMGVYNPTRARASAPVVGASEAFAAVEGDAVAVKQGKRRMAAPKHADAMEQDRAPLGEMVAKDFYPDGLTEESVTVVEGEKTHRKGSSLANEIGFDSPAKSVAAVAVQEAEYDAEAETDVEGDMETQSKEIFVCEDADA